MASYPTTQILLNQYHFRFRGEQLADNSDFISLVSFLREQEFEGAFLFKVDASNFEMVAHSESQGGLTKELHKGNVLVTWENVNKLYHVNPFIGYFPDAHTGKPITFCVDLQDQVPVNAIESRQVIRENVTKEYRELQELVTMAQLDPSPTVLVDFLPADHFATSNI